uniref:E3 ubiquitin-protein ligase Topors n=1 Tax=Lygus hesperus TaxID=30085 RepID=A0A0A9YTV6_LYGHE
MSDVSEKSPRKERPTRPTSDVDCPICFENITNEAVTNTCRHKFCFSCLSEWSKVKPECPLCKHRFSIIFHTINSKGDYEEYRVGGCSVAVTEDTTQVNWAGAHHGPVAMNPFVCINVDFPRAARLGLTSTIRMNRTSPEWSSASNVQFRRDVYQRNVWLEEDRVRLSSLEFHSENPPQTSRFIPWFTREGSVSCIFPMNLSATSNAEVESAAPTDEPIAQESDDLNSEVTITGSIPPVHLRVPQVMDEGNNNDVVDVTDGSYSESHSPSLAPHNHTRTATLDDIGDNRDVIEITVTTDSLSAPSKSSSQFNAPMNHKRTAKFFRPSYHNNTSSDEDPDSDNSGKNFPKKKRSS